MSHLCLGAVVPQRVSLVHINTLNQLEIASGFSRVSGLVFQKPPKHKPTEPVPDARAGEA